jgi:hypothetical protein
MNYLGGYNNIPGAPGNLIAGGFSLKDLLPNSQWDIPAQHPSQYLKPGAKPSLKQMFPARPGTYGADPNDPFERHIPAANSALLDNTGDSPYQQLNEELIKRGLMPGGGPQLPLAQGMPGMMPTITSSMNPGINAGMTPMGNAGFYAGPQLGQSVPPGYVNKIVS